VPLNSPIDLFRCKYSHVSSFRFITGETVMTNVGTLDRTLRFLQGALLVAAVFVPPFAGMVAPWGAWKYALTVWGGGDAGDGGLPVLPGLYVAGHPDLSGGQVLMRPLKQAAPS
jgi:hypothetical protein